MLQKTTRMHLV